MERAPDGRYRGRLPGNGGRLDPCATYEQAEAELDAALHALAAGTAAPVGGVTLAGFGAEMLDLREARGMGGADADRSRWETHVESAYFAAWALGSITTRDVRSWLDGMLAKRAAPGHGQRRKPRPLARSTVQSTLNLLRVVFAEAVERELVAANPCDGVRLPRGRGRTHEPWTYLLPDEQQALLTCEAIPSERRRLIAFAIGSGLRQGEQWNLEVRDVRPDEGKLVVRFGGHARATKGKRIRRLPLLPLALAAAKAQLAALESQPNPSGLAWPHLDGARRQRGEPSWWRSALAAAGVVRAEELPAPRTGSRGPVPRRFAYSAEHRHDGRMPRWHDLRHTCASSLVAGWWGRRWSLEEVKALLGHRSITTTERYAHLADSVLDVAARATRSPHDLPTAAASSVAKYRSHLGDLNPRPTVYESTGDPKDLAAVGALRGEIVGLSARAVDALRAVHAGGPDAYRVATDVLLEVAALGARVQAAAERRRA